GFPDLAVPFGGPDARALDAVELVPQTLHVERQAVLEDRPGTELRRERGVCTGERLGHRAAGLVNGADLLAQGDQEPTGLLDRRLDVLPPTDDSAPATDELLGRERLHRVQGARGPVGVEGVAGVQRGLSLDEVPGEQDLLL